MKAHPKYLEQDKVFWAYVRTISEVVGYTVRKGNKNAGDVLVPTTLQITAALQKRGLSVKAVVDTNGKLTAFGKLLRRYFIYRARVLNEQVYGNLMDVSEAEALFKKLSKKHLKVCPLPMNKQKGNKKVSAYLTGIVNMIIESNAGEFTCDYAPGRLTTVTKNGLPIRTFARRLDGAFPSNVNPVAVWEIKEFYHTTTFGSRVAGGVYESILDGMEIEELRVKKHIKMQHLLIVDARDTWWKSGRSYLCRIIDMLHMGYIDEAIFGKEVVDVLPRLVKKWKIELRKSKNRTDQFRQSA